MSGVVTPYMSLTLLQLFFHRGFTPAFTEVEVALTRRVPVTNAGLVQVQGDEPIGGGYRRSNAVPLSSSTWQINGAGEVFNFAPITWPLDCTVTWGTIHGWALISRGTTPAVLAIGDLVQPIRFLPPMRPHLPAGSLSFGIYDA